MADTLQTVRWALGAGERRNGHLWLSQGRESLEEVLWESIRRAGLDGRMRSAFQITEPLWYGLWIGSPLTATQCSLLRDMFEEAVRLVPRYGKHLEEFTRALAESVESGEPLHVELAPPGHVDFGWVTTFVHCPRCKAEGPVERWQQTYSEEPLECPVCGHSYSPAATHSSEREFFAETVCCRSCGAVHRVRDFSDDEIQNLEDRHTFDELDEERSWLRRVEDFYKRHPGLEGEIKPHFLMVLESDDPEVREAMFAGIPFDEIELPPSRTSGHRGSGEWSEEDEEVADYLKHHHFLLEGRKPFVEDSIERLGLQVFHASAVRCRTCGGHLT